MTKNYIEGIDYLRAIMSVFVVVWHMGGGGKSLIFSEEEYHQHVFTVSDFINFNILLLAVPTFIFISNFLYALGCPNRDRLSNRLKRLLILLTFWSAAFLKYTDSYHDLLALYPGYLNSIAAMILSAGGTVYWYFVSLTTCLILTHFFAKLRLQFQIVGFALSVIILACTPLLTEYFGFFALSAYWNPMNFIPLTFAAVLVAQNNEYVRQNSRKLVCVSVILFVIFAIFEWNYAVGGIFFLGQNYAIPAYTRTSSLFGVLALAIIPVSNPGIRANGLIRYMSKYSLGLYCIHPFIIYQVYSNVGRFVENELLSIYISVIITILLSYAIVTVLKTYYLKEEIIM